MQVCAAVYPRVGGGNTCLLLVALKPAGLSPRGRGKLRPTALLAFRAGSIPAWAGETWRRWHPRQNSGVYPRVGGGNSLGYFPGASGVGLSPRGRGKLYPPGIHPLHLGSIPAWAGETPKGWTTTTAAMVYPRVGGGNGISVPYSIARKGLSPRGRGKRSAPWPMRKGSGSIPAWAGETSAQSRWAGVPAVYPRVGGGNMAWLPPKSPCRGLSPRGRGKHPRRGNPGNPGRSIPAWAGETEEVSLADLQAAVYPRVGGGNPNWAFQVPPVTGLSPRGRGKLDRQFIQTQGHRSIPAWAGETGRAVPDSDLPAVYPRVGGGNQGRQSGI